MMSERPLVAVRRTNSGVCMCVRYSNSRVYIYIVERMYSIHIYIYIQLGARERTFLPLFS